MTMTASSAQSQPATLPPPGDGYKIHAKQREAIGSDARYKILKWGRRAGKNVVAVIEVVEFLRDPASVEWGRDDPTSTPDDQPITVWWVGRSYNQAERYGFEKVKAAIPSSWIANKSESEPYMIELTNGTRAEFRTYDHPETLQGAGVDGIVVDERDYMADRVWNNDLDPMLMDFEGWAMWISKPVRPRSLFAKWFDLGQSSDHPEFFSLHATSADNPFIAEDPEEKKGTVPNHVYQQQYLAQLPDDGGQVFKKLDERLFTASYQLEGDIIEGVGEAKRDPKKCTPPFAVGVDFARHRDYRVTIAIDAVGELAYFSRNQNESWDTIEADVKSVHAAYPGIVIPDASRDNKIIPDLAQAGVTLEPTKFSKQTKKSLIEDLVTRVETGELTAPSVPELDQLRLELRQLEKDVTDGGYTRYNAPETGNDDCVDSYALAASQLDRISAAARRREARDDDEENGSSGVSYL